jgi:hypothetical protein
MTTETIEVRYQPVGSIASLTFYHTLVVYTNSSGNQWVARGGPEGGESTGYGNLRTSIEPYTEAHVDWPKVGVVDKSTTVASGDDLSGTWREIVTGFNGIDNNGAYDRINNNCNTATYEGLKAASLDFPSHPEIFDIEVPGEGFQWWDKFGDWISENWNDFKEWTKENWDSFNDWFGNNLDKLEKYILDSLLDFHKSLSDLGEDINNLFHSAHTWQAPIDPLALDLDGDGIETAGINGSAGTVLFDHNADGIRTGTGWLKPDDAFLVLDRNGNGTIDSGRELFGVDTMKSNGQKAADGLDALADLDSNHDGVFDANDAAFANVRLWRDLNQDGISQANELGTLAQNDIVSINLDGHGTTTNLGNGNTQGSTATFIRADGSEGAAGTMTEGTAANLNLADNPFYRQFEDSIELSPEVAGLPDMRGSGAVRDLREAAQLSPELAEERFRDGIHIYAASSYSRNQW